MGFNYQSCCINTVRTNGRNPQSRLSVFTVLHSIESWIVLPSYIQQQKIFFMNFSFALLVDQCLTNDNKMTIES